MKYHYVYFIALPILLFAAFVLPLTVDEYDGVRELMNSFDDDFTWIIYTVPTFVATTLLLIPNRVTALIGSSVYFLSFGLSIFMNFALSNGISRVPGLGARLILAVMLAGTVIGIIHTVKLFRLHNTKPSKNADVLDDLFE